MGHSVVDIIADPLEGKLLIAEGEAKKGGAYIARIVGTDKKYKYQREFISEKETLGTRGQIVRAKVPVSTLQSPVDLLEIRAGGSWKQEYRHFYLYNALENTINQISENRLREKLAEILQTNRRES